MKKYKLYRSLLCLLMGLFIITACSDEESFVIRNTDSLEFSYKASTEEITVCTNGNWTITTDDTWFTLSDTLGKGNGTTRESIKVTASRNLGAARQGEIVLHAAGKDLSIVIKQDEGTLILGNPSVSGTYMAKQAIENGSISIPYTKGSIGQKITFTTVVSGNAASGIAIAASAVTLDSEEGTVVIPVTGTPATSGDVLFTVSTNVQGLAPVVLTTKVTKGVSVVYYEQHFNLMVWGGDCVAGLEGIKGGFIGATGASVIDETKPVVACSAGTDGSSDLTSTMDPSYRDLRGFTGWTGKRVYERPGYIKIGTATSTDGYIVTPALSNILVAKTNVNVSLKVSQYYQDNNGVLYITILNGGTSSIAEYTMRPGPEMVWETLNFTITDATPDTQIKISAAAVASRRFSVDDLVVTQAD